MAQYEITWNGEEVKKLIIDITTEAMTQFALAVESQAKQNVVANDQVDTGFMLNSIWSRSPNHSTYAAISPPDGVVRDLAQEEELGDSLAIVGAAALYAIYQESKKPFIWSALTTITPRFGRIIEEIGPPALEAAE